MATHSFLPQRWREDQHPLRTLRQEMDDFFESWSKDLKLPEVAWPRTEFSPRVNVSETDKEMMITAELPGVDQKDIEVTVSGNQLLIKGEKKSEVEEAVRLNYRILDLFDAMLDPPFEFPDGFRAAAALRGFHLQIMPCTPIIEPATSSSARKRRSSTQPGSWMLSARSRRKPN